jgi:hypothetical protein
LAECRPCPIFASYTLAFALQLKKNAEENPDEPEPTDGDIQTEFSTDYLYSPSFGEVTKNYLKELRSV